MTRSFFRHSFIPLAPSFEGSKVEGPLVYPEAQPKGRSLSRHSPLATRHFSFVNVILLVVMTCTGCGYHVAGKNNALPRSIHVIAVPAIENKTSVYRIEQRLTSATVHEFLVRTPYRVVPDPENADAVLRGKVLSLEAVPLTFDTATGRATNMLVTVKCEITFEERETGKVLYHTDNFLFRNQYEIPTVLVPGTTTVNPNSVAGFFQEQDPALDRLAQDFAARLVAAVTENY